MIGRDHSKDLVIYGNNILEWIIGTWGGKVWTECIWLRVDTNVGLLNEHDNEPFGSIKDKFLD
jgi:hypothetical protein